MPRIKKLHIGNIKLDNSIILAPMAGISDLPMRLLSKEGGAGLVYTEMVSARALVYGDNKTKKLLKIHDEERPVAAQIFGGDTYTMGEAAKIIRDMGADIIDINLGCPVKKIAKAGAGAKLLANEKLTSYILESVVKSVDIPVTVKIRIGLLPGQNVAPEILKIAYDAGIKMAAVHARPASQGHSGEPDMEAFAQACESAKIPIVANGGITDELTAEKFLNIEGCSGLMIGRGAIGNYSIFRRIADFFNKGEVAHKASWEEKVEWFKKHAKHSVEHYGEERGYVLLRKVAHYYVKDLPNAAKIRDKFNKVVKNEDFEGVLACISDSIALCRR